MNGCSSTFPTLSVMKIRLSRSPSGAPHYHIKVDLSGSSQAKTFTIPFHAFTCAPHLNLKITKAEVPNSTWTTIHQWDVMVML